MSSAPNHLPDDVESLKALVLEQVEHNAQLRADNVRYQARILTLEEQLNLALVRRYAASSEKISAYQLRLFDEAETEIEPGGTETVEVTGHTRKKRGRKPLPATLPRIEVIHELAESERLCPHDGCVLKEIGEAVSEQLDIVPAKIQVIRHICKKGTVKLT